MGSPSTSSSGSIRLGGLTSGFDTEGIIQQLLSVDQARIDSLAEKKEIENAKIQTWNDVAAQLQSFAETVETLKSEGTSGNTLFDDKSATPADETIVTASATSSAVVADYNITVTTLARAHVAYGSQKASTYTLPSSGTIIMGGASISLTAGQSLDEIASAITNASYAAGSEMIATVIDERLVVQTKSMGTSATIHGTVAGSPPFVNGTDDPNNILRDELGFISAGGNLTNESQTSADASFSVNGIALTRDNNNPTDVISGVTLNLQKAGSTTVSVAHNTTKIKEAVEQFVNGFNETRDLILRTREAKLNEEDQFGLFASDSLLRELFNVSRQLTTTGVQMGGADWAGSVTVKSAASAGATSITLENFTNATGTLKKGDQFTLAGDTTIYTLQNDASISGNEATIQLNPPLVVALSSGEAVSLAYRSLDDMGVGVRTDVVSGVEGILGVIDEDKLDSILATDVDLMKRIFTRNDSTSQTTGVARRLYDWIDRQTKISVFTTIDRSIDDIKIPGLQDSVESIEDQISRLEARLAQKETGLVRKFSEMENALSRAQSAGNTVSGFASGGG